MSSYTFRWPHAANEVFVTGTFDDWGKSVQLDRQDDIFQKTVSLPTTDEKVHYKFVVDGLWTTDSSAPEENDGSNNINNVLYPEQIQKATEQENEKENENDSAPPSEPISNTAVMAGVTPDSTTAAMAANVPKKADQVAGAVPGGFPETPGHEPEAFSVNPIPASSGAGNPIHLAPGEKVPDSSTFNSNTVESTARTDPAAYEQDASHPLSGASFGGGSSLAGMSSASNPVSTANRRPSKMDPDSGLPVEGESVGLTDTGVTVESAAPESTTAGLASQVPLKSQEPKSVNGGGVGAVNEVPSVVKNSLSEAHRDPEAAASEAAVQEKKEIEDELRQKVGLDESPGTPAPTSTAATSGAAPGTAISDNTTGAATSGATPGAATGVAAGAATSGAATSGNPTTGATGAATSGTTSGAAPGTATSGNPSAAATSEEAPVASGNGAKSTQVSPRSASPSQPVAGTGAGGVGTTGSKGETAEGLASSQGATGTAGQTESKAAGGASEAKNESSAANTAKQANGDQTARKDYADKAKQEASDLAKDQKKKNRASGLFQKLKEKLK